MRRVAVGLAVTAHIRFGMHVVLGAVLLLGAVSVRAQEAQDEAAHVLAVEGTVERWADLDQDEKWRVTQGDALVATDWLQTWRGAHAEVALLDDDSVTLTEQTTIRVSELARLGDGGKVTTLDLRLGEIFSKVERFREREDRFEVRTPTATAAVRGTAFYVSYTLPEDATPEAVGVTRVRVLEGLVEVTIADLEESLEIQAGDELTISELSVVTVTPIDAEPFMDEVEPDAMMDSLLEQADQEAEQLEQEMEAVEQLMESIDELTRDLEGEDDVDDF